MLTGPAPLVSGICSECGAPVDFPLGALQVRCDHCQAGMAVDAGQRLLRLDCPRCRGNFYYLDGNLCSRCPYCDAELLALTRDRLLRYLVRPVAPSPEAGARLLLLPFWHLRGLVYGWDLGKRVQIVEDRSSDGYGQGMGPASEVVSRQERRDSGPQRIFRGRVVSQSLADAATLAHGVTALGVRGSVFPMEPFSAAAEQMGQVIPPTLPLEVVREKLVSSALDLAHSDLTQIDLQRADLVADSLSLFYYPYWVSQTAARTIWDGVSGTPERLVTSTAPPAPPAAGTYASFDELRLLELVCQACGGSLLAGNGSRVLPCRACGQHWEVTGAGLRAFPAQTARPLRAGERLAWLPFWRVAVEASYEGRQASRVGDLREVLGLHSPPGELAGLPPEAPLAYFVPAFGAPRAPRLCVAARDMTRLQPLLEPGPRGAGELYHCFFGPEDARRLGYATLLQFVPPNARRVRSLRVSPGEVSLWYVPFENSGRELQNLLTGLRYDSTVFRGVRH